jgi:hypothetical protein
MKTFAMSLAAAMIAAASASSPAFADYSRPTIDAGSGTNCRINTVRCKRRYGQTYPTRTVAVRDHSGTVRKRLVCKYTY